MNNPTTKAPKGLNGVNRLHMGWRMKRINLILLCAISALASFAQVDYNVIPLPLSIALSHKGEEFSLTTGAVVSFPADNPEMLRNAQMLCDYLRKSTGLSLTAEARSQGKGASVRLLTGLKNENPEAYTLTVDKKGVTIQGASESGVFRGIQTLRKAIGVAEGDTVRLPYVTITDEPRFSYRGVHIDCSRHFFPVDFLKTYIDILALHGCNNLHWHLTDDQGWRFEVKSMPLLTQEGSIRKETVIGSEVGGIFDGQEYGRGLYYTQEQCREIVQYAAERYINVIPEIDLPGHMVAALHVYPQLGCTGGPYEVWTQWGVAQDILCAGNPETLVFLKKVLGELTDVFPSKLIHIGGDEAPRTRWQQCPKCQAKMKELGLVNEAQLQTYINQELEAFLSEKGRTVIGWDEVLEGGLSENATVMSWHGADGAVAAASQRHNVIMTPTSYCYFDYYQLSNRDAQPRAIGGYVPISKVYSLEPVPSELPEDLRQYVLGAQCNLWAEHIFAPQQMEFMLLPRLSALCEVQWTQADRKDYEVFKSRLPRMMELYGRLGWKYCRWFE